MIKRPTPSKSPSSNASKGPNFQINNNLKNAIVKRATDAAIAATLQNLAKNAPKMSKAYTEVMNPYTGTYERVIAGAKLINDQLPPNRKVTVDNLYKLGENAFKGVKTPQGEQRNVMNSSYGLSKAPNPKPVNLNSGISPNCYANDYMNPIEDQCSPMHISAASLRFNSSVSNELGNYLLKTIAFDIQTRAQANIHFALDISSTFSDVKIINAMNAVLNSLQVYYYYASILSYESDPRNKNSAMINLRSGITSQMISDLAQIQRRLEDTPCPPRILQWVRYMSMNYLSGNTQGASLLKIAPFADFVTNTSAISVALSDLTTHNATYAVMRRAIPQWRIGKLYDVPTIPTFDQNFLTIFANLPMAIKNQAGTVLGVTNTSAVDPFAYVSYNNRLDGAAYAMTSVYITNSLDFVPGLIIPMSTAVHGSRKSFYRVGPSTDWYNSAAYQFLSISRPETFALVNFSDTVLRKAHLSGSEMCIGVTANAVGQTARNFVDFLFNVNSIPVVGKLNSFNKPGIY